MERKWLLVLFSIVAGSAVCQVPDIGGRTWLSDKDIYEQIDDPVMRSVALAF